MSTNNPFILSIKTQNKLVLLSLFIISILALIIHSRFWDYIPQHQDIYYIWLEGKRIILGENPYGRILAGNIRENDKYATYFPLFYLLSAFTQLIGLREFSDWIVIWYPISFIFNIGISFLLFYNFYRNKLFILGLFASSFWLMNRWTIEITKIAHIDFVPLFFLILSLMTLSRYKNIALLLFGLSLSFKQIAILLLPLYLIWSWQLSDKNKFKHTLKSLLIILIIPLLISLPFIVWNAEGFFKSILFSATRNPSGHLGVDSIEAYIGYAVPTWIGIKAKLLTLSIMSLVFISVLKRQIGIYTSTLLIMVVFVDFNAVLFKQYFCWVVPFITLSICEINVSQLKKGKRKPV